MEFRTKETATYHELPDGRRRWILAVGEKVMMIMVELEPGSTVSWHSHPQEQISLVLNGRAEVRVSDGTYTFGEGTTYYFKPNEPHETRNPGPGKLVVVEVFAPPREELLRGP